MSFAFIIVLIVIEHIICSLSVAIIRKPVYNILQEKEKAVRSMDSKILLVDDEKDIVELIEEVL